MAILTVKGVSFKYPLCERAAVKNVSFGLEEGEFVILCGAGGSGKSTLLRCLKREVIPNGEFTGTVSVAGEDTADMDTSRSAAVIGFVSQECEQQIVTDKVWHELAFGLESIGAAEDEIALRVAETAAFFGLNDKLHMDTAALSGGEKQLLALAAVMVMRPKILVLDEPSSQLDPIAARSFAETVRRLNRDRNITVIIAEHRLDNILPFADRLMLLKDGELVLCEYRDSAVSSGDEGLLSEMPATVRIGHELGCGGRYPCDVNSARHFITGSFKNDVRITEKEKRPLGEEKALEIKNVTHRYERDGKDIIDGLTLSVFKGEVFALLGANGSGKTTALSLISGGLRAVSGSIKVFGKRLKDYKNNSLYTGTLAMLPQDVTTLFLHNTVREELEEMHIEQIPFGLEKYLDKHPYDLSGGERQLLALAKVLAVRPRLLLLDEPTKSLDAQSRGRLLKILYELRQSGMTIVIVTHDTEFCAECADRCAVLFMGRALSPVPAAQLLADNDFFTTPASLISRGHYDLAVTPEDVITLCRKNGRKDR